jgi:hypothetical protein
MSVGRKFSWFLLEEVRGNGRLTMNKALLNHDVLAIAYKIEGRKITKQDASKFVLSSPANSPPTPIIPAIMMHKIHNTNQFFAVRTFTSARREINAVISHLERGMSSPEYRLSNLKNSDQAQLRSDLDRVSTALNRTDDVRHSLAEQPDIEAEPISKVIYPGGPAGMPMMRGGIAQGNVGAPSGNSGNSGTSSVLGSAGGGGGLLGRQKWFEYNTWHTQRLLHIEGKRSVVSAVNWMSDVLIEVLLHGIPTRFFVSPLERVEEGLRDDEVQVGDSVILVGQYIVIAVPATANGDTGEEFYHSANAAAHHRGGGAAPTHGRGEEEERYIMTNWLWITDMEEIGRTRRGMNRGGRQEVMMPMVFV